MSEALLIEIQPNKTLSGNHDIQYGSLIFVSQSFIALWV